MSELLEPRRQRTWGLLAVSYFILGGTGVGLYLFFTGYRLLEGAALKAPEDMPVKILSCALVCLGFLALTFEAGRPARGIYLLRNLRRSWVSIEVLSGSLFILCSALDLLFPGTILYIPAACAALGLGISQGFIIYRARAIPSWNARDIPLLFLSSAVVMGAGLFLAAGAVLNIGLGGSATIILLICLMLNMAAWIMYLTGSGDKYFSGATAFLRRPLALFLVIGVGQLLPACLLVALIMAGTPDRLTALDSGLNALIGFAVLFGGVSQKFGIILGASFFRGVVMGGTTLSASAMKQRKRK